MKGGLLFELKKKLLLGLNLYNKVHCAEIRNKTDYENFQNKNQNKKIFSLAKKLNQNLKEKKELLGDLFYFKFAYKRNRILIEKETIHGSKRGFCIYCNNFVDFKYHFWDEYDCVPFRAELSCPKCQNYTRLRAMFSTIQKLINKRKNLNIYCMEQVTNFYEDLKNWNTESTVIGSEFISNDSIPGQLYDEIRHEDALNLSFKDNSLDFIISNDVYEHVPEINTTFKEAYRALKKGGYLVFTIPFSPEKDETVIRAEIKNNELILLMEAEIHGNPMSKNGSLAFYNPGWDILDMQRKAGFNDPYIIAICDEKFGYIDYSPMLIFVAQK